MVSFRLNLPLFQRAVNWCKTSLGMLHFLAKIGFARREYALVVFAMFTFVLSRVSKINHYLLP
jgi:hypothetical protein